MIDLSSLSGLSTVALGGVVAAVVAGWKQIRGLITQVTALVIVTAHVDPRFQPSVVRYIRGTHKPVPSGIMTIGSGFKLVSGTRYSIRAPYVVSNPTTIYYGRHGIVSVSISESSLTLRGIRGLTRFRRIFDDVMTEDADKTRKLAKDMEEDSRYQVIKVMGKEKTQGGSFSRSNSSDSANSPTQALNSDFAKFQPVISVDRLLSTVGLGEDSTKEIDPMEGLFFESEVLDHFEKAKQWADMGEWYRERGIPWRRGWLLYGPGGTGKSSIAKGLAQTLKVPVYQYYLGTLSDQEFSAQWESMATPCVALFEDFDNIFHGREPQSEHKLLNFDTVLNHVSGVDARDGVFLVVTTNNLDKIDSAMGVSHDGGFISTRPGRIDTVIEVGVMGEENRRKLAQSILRDWPDLVENAVSNTFNMTPSQVQEYCLQQAFVRIHEETGDRKRLENVTWLAQQKPKDKARA